MGLARVRPPPGGFLQATAEGERILAELALDAVQGARRVADLFCGAGAFALASCRVVMTCTPSRLIGRRWPPWRRAAGARRAAFAL